MAKWSVVVVGCILYLAMALHGVAHDSGTYDEFVHATAGYSYWAFDDYRLNPENGNWAQRIVALPLVGAARGAFPSRDQSAWHASDMWSLSDQLFFAPGRDADALLFKARVAVAVVGALLGVLVFLWSRSLFGTAGGYVSLALYVFSPTMLAHGALATSDVIGAAFFTAALWALWTVLHRVTPLTVSASVLATGGLFLAKPSAPVFIPIALAMIGVRLVSQRPVELDWRGKRAVSGLRARSGVFAALLLAHVVAGVALIWASYSFRYSAFAPGSSATDAFLDSWQSILDKPGIATSLAEWGRLHHVLPEAFLYGLSTVVAYGRARTSFLNGTMRTGGSAAFFPYAILVKTTVPALLLLIGVPVILARRWRAAWRLPDVTHPWSDLYALTPLLAGTAVYAAFVLSSSLNIGHRHLLPIIPAAMILTGIVGRAAFETGQLRGRRAVAAGGVVALLAWHAGESVWIAPHYLAYFNEIDGGPSQAYRHLVDSSLDWGQDLPGLKNWLDGAGLQGASHPPVFLSYFGTALPSHYGIDATLLPGFPDRWVPHEPAPLTAGIYCFSATMLQGLYFMTPGAWTPRYESDYQSMIYNLKLFDSTATNPASRQALLRQTGEQFWVKNFQAFEHLRTARLAASLRRRAPDAEIGYSILAYRVSDEELSRALLGDAPYPR